MAVTLRNGIVGPGQPHGMCQSGLGRLQQTKGLEAIHGAFVMSANIGGLTAIAMVHHVVLHIGAVMDVMAAHIMGHMHVMGCLQRCLGRGREEWKQRHHGTEQKPKAGNNRPLRV